MQQDRVTCEQIHVRTLNPLPTPPPQAGDGAERVCGSGRLQSAEYGVSFPAHFSAAMVVVKAVVSPLRRWSAMARPSTM